MKTPLLLLASAVFVVGIAGCSKDNDDNNNGTPTDTPSIINLTLPGTGSIYTNGSPLRVEGDMTDTDGLSNARVEIRNKTTGSVYFQQSNTAGGVSFFRFGFSWTITGVTAATPAIVKVTATDKNSKQVFVEREILLDN